MLHCGGRGDTLLTFMGILLASLFGEGSQLRGGINTVLFEDVKYGRNKVELSRYVIIFAPHKLINSELINFIIISSSCTVYITVNSDL
jgi:hypothetical protein